MQIVVLGLGVSFYLGGKERVLLIDMVFESILRFQIRRSGMWVEKKEE
jgi:hypothetical protein